MFRILWPAGFGKPRINKRTISRNKGMKNLVFHRLFSSGRSPPNSLLTFLLQRFFLSSPGISYGRTVPQLAPFSGQREWEGGCWDRRTVDIWETRNQQGRKPSLRSAYCTRYTLYNHSLKECSFGTNFMSHLPRGVAWPCIIALTSQSKTHGHPPDGRVSG